MSLNTVTSGVWNLIVLPTKKDDTSWTSRRNSASFVLPLGGHLKQYPTVMWKGKVVGWCLKTSLRSFRSAPVQSSSRISAMMTRAPPGVQLKLVLLNAAVKERPRWRQRSSPRVSASRRAPVKGRGLQEKRPRWHIDGLVQGRRSSSALAMELRLSCTNPSIWGARKHTTRW